MATGPDIVNTLQYDYGILSDHILIRRDNSGLYPVYQTLDKVIGYGDELHAAIKSSLAAAEKGVALSNIFANLENKSQDFEEIFTKANRIVDKGRGRSIQAHGQLTVVHAGLLTVSNFIPPSPLSRSETIYRSQKDLTLMRSFLRSKTPI